MDLVHADLELGWCWCCCGWGARSAGLLALAYDDVGLVGTDEDRRSGLIEAVRRFFLGIERWLFLGVGGRHSGTGYEEYK